MSCVPFVSLWANVRTEGEFCRVFFWHHNFARGFGGEGGLAAHAWWFYGPRLLMDLLPWSVLLPLAGWLLFARKPRADDAEARFGAVWLLVLLALLSCMRFKRADYLLPAYPGAALLIGCAVERWCQRPHDARRVAVAVGGVAVACLAGWLGYLEWAALGQAETRPDRRFAEEVRRRTAGHVLFFRAVAFHVGRPLHTLLEWENLDVWAAKPTSTYVVMPADCAEVWRHHLSAGGLVEVLRSSDLTNRPHERPLVLLRTEPYGTAEARAGKAAKND